MTSQGRTQVMDKLLTWISCWFLAAVFLYAGLDKMFHYNGFVRALSSYVVVPEGLGQYLAMLVILLELAAGAALLRRQWRRSAALLAASLLAVFTVALAVNYWVKPEAICGCWFTITLSSGKGQHMLQNIVLCGLALSVYFTEGRKSELAGPIQGATL